jgi:hypothetical protein
MAGLDPAIHEIPGASPRVTGGDRTSTDVAPGDPMDVTIHIPDDLASRLGSNLLRRALEALALEELRQVSDQT